MAAATVPDGVRPAWAAEVSALRAAVASRGLPVLLLFVVAAGLIERHAAVAPWASIRWVVVVPILAVATVYVLWLRRGDPTRVVTALLVAAGAALAWTVAQQSESAWQLAVFLLLACAGSGLAPGWVGLLLAAAVAALAAPSVFAGVSLEQQLALRFPALVAAAFGVTLALIVESLLRQAALARAQLDDFQRRAEAANAARSRFVAAASHDLRQPLHALAFLAHGLRQRLKGDAVEETLRRMEQAAQTIDRMFADLLEFSKLDAGAVKLKVEPVPLAAAFETLQTEFLPQARAKGLSLNLYKTDLVCLSDRVALQRVLSNLVSNAIRYTDQGVVQVRAATDGKRVRIQVRDTGVGIPRADQETIFEEFRQVRRDRGGTGLGLAIAKRLCTTLGHRIEVESEPGRGSTFSVTAARAAIPARHAAAAAVDVDVRTTGEPTRLGRPDAAAGSSQRSSVILYVEDDPQVRQAVRPVIESWGYTVVDATDAAEAEAKLSQLISVPDMMIVDHDLRGGETSDHVIAHIRGIYGEAIPSLVVTGNVEAAEGIGPAAAMVKPVDPERLRAAVEAARRAGSKNRRT